MQTISFLLDNNSTVLRDLVEASGNNLTLESLVEAQQLLNLSNPDNIWAVMTEVHEKAEEVAFQLSLVDWQLFMPVSSEAAMERLVSDYNW